MPISDATPAYRGYRRQALYVLWRILTAGDKSTSIFEPEGTEDLSIRNANGELVEVIQVKDYSEKLTVSHFKPDKADSFFYRMLDVVRTNADTSLVIASFGAVGPELRKACTGDAAAVKAIASRLSRYTPVNKQGIKGPPFISVADAELIISKIQIIQLDEGTLRKEIFERLRKGAPGADPESAFELLSFWIYVNSEAKNKIAYADVIARINDVGRFAAERATWNREWLTTIVPISDRIISVEERAQLEESFYTGVSSRYEHILADVDVPRPTKLAEIAAAFRKSQSVIVHGASGQGKTALAYRYLREYFPEMWRFQVKVIEGRVHALSLARALVGQASAVGVPVAIYLDVSADDLSWPELVRELVIQPNIQVLVTIREEDLQRMYVPRYQFQPELISLGFGRTEAAQIYESLIQKQSARFASFDEAWDQFGGGGPLLEFVYLVTQGGLLKERLQEQVARLQDRVIKHEIESGAIQLLRWVAVASAYEARLDVRRVVSALSLIAPDRTLPLLEGEYLIRLSDSGNLVGGLHPIRSEILSELLSTVISWSETAMSCLPYIDERDIGTFLIYAFSRRPSDTEQLLSSLETYQPQSWLAIAGVLRALLWLGLREYVDENKRLIVAAAERVGDGWTYLLDSDIADLLNSDTVNFLTTNLATDLRAQQTDKAAVFSRAKEWLSRRDQKPLAPNTSQNWEGVGEVVYWLGYLGIDWPLSDWLSSEELDKACIELPLQSLGYLTVGLEVGHTNEFSSWLDRNREPVMHRFRKETLTPVLEDNGQKLTAHFIVDVRENDDANDSGQATQTPVVAQTSKSDRLHNLTLEHLELLARLFPDRELFASQGYGHRIWGVSLPKDSTHKTGIIKSAFTPSWRVRLNATFDGLGEQFFRPTTWQDYVTNTIELRRKTLASLQQLERGLNVFLRKRAFAPGEQFPLLGDEDADFVKQTEWMECNKKLQQPPLLPASFMDEWGFMRESSAEPIRKARRNNTGKVLNSLLVQDAVGNMDLYKPMYRKLNNYWHPINTFFAQARGAMALNSALAKRSLSQTARDSILNEARQDGVDPDKISLSVWNFADAVKALTPFQLTFRNALGVFYDADDLAALERDEQKILRRLWAMWFFFVLAPETTFQNPMQECSQELVNSVRPIRGRLQSALDKLRLAQVTVELKPDGILWDGEPVLCITIDGEDMVKIYSALDPIVAAIRKSVPANSSDKLLNYALDFSWPSVSIVPLLKGRTLSGEAWHINRAVLVSADRVPGWYNFVPKPLPTDTSELLRVANWSTPDLELGTRLQQLTNTVVLLVRHLADIAKIPRPDDLSTQEIDSYSKGVLTPLADNYATLLDFIGQLESMVRTAIESGKDPRVSLEHAAEALQLLRNAITLPSEATQLDKLTPSEFDSWSNQLGKCSEYALIYNLVWATYVAANTSNR